MTDSDEAYLASLGERVRQCIVSMGGQTRASAITGIPMRTLSNYVGGRNDLKSSAAAAIAEHAGVTVEWLVTGNGQAPAPKEKWKRPEPGKLKESEQTDFSVTSDSFVRLPVLNVAASAGGGAVQAMERQVGSIGFDSAWLRSMLDINPSALFTITTVGESMEPTIKAGEFLLVSRAEHHTRPGDGIYVIRLGDNVLVKRLQLLPDRRIRISSDNTSYDPYELKLDDGSDFAVIGKVVLVHGLRKV